jgi:hypothetical protein
MVVKKKRITQQKRHITVKPHPTEGDLRFKITDLKRGYIKKPLKD